MFSSVVFTEPVLVGRYYTSVAPDSIRTSKDDHDVPVWKRVYLRAKNVHWKTGLRRDARRKMNPHESEIKFVM